MRFLPTILNNRYMKTNLSQIEYADKALRERCGLTDGHMLTSELLAKECFSYADIVAAFEAGEKSGASRAMDIVRDGMDDFVNGLKNVKHGTEH